ncbi:MAG: hypothetical protein KBA26_06985 [Candidatus Delongbacteria bacterium]|nr:hypothetical protein [Candidatus Delongbacteria bacterium]
MKFTQLWLSLSLLMIGFGCNRNPDSGPPSSDTQNNSAGNYRDQTYLKALHLYQHEKRYESAIYFFKEFIRCAQYGDSARVDSARHFLQAIRRESFFVTDTLKQVSIHIKDADISDDVTTIKLIIANHRSKPLEFTPDYFFLIDRLRSKIKPDNGHTPYRIDPGDSVKIKLHFKHPQSEWSTFVFFIPEIQLSYRKIYNEL